MLIERASTMPTQRIVLPIGAFRWRTTSNFHNISVGDVVRDQRRQGAKFKIVYIHVYKHPDTNEDAADVYVVRHEEE